MWLLSWDNRVIEGGSVKSKSDVFKRKKWWKKDRNSFNRQSVVSCILKSNITFIHVVSAIKYNCVGNPLYPPCRAEMLGGSENLGDLDIMEWWERTPRCIATSSMSGSEQRSWTRNNECKMHCGISCKDSMTIKEGHGWLVLMVHWQTSTLHLSTTGS